MKDLTVDSPLHIGHKISGVRRLVGKTQKELADTLGVTKQAVSKMEQAEKIDEERLEQVAKALGVTKEGLKSYNSEQVLYYTNNFYDNSGVQIHGNGLNGKIETFNTNLTVEQFSKLFEELLKMERQKFDQVSSEGQ